MNKNTSYRKLNDGSHSSGTYHKKDGTPIRQILKLQLKKELENVDTKPSADRDL